MLSCIVVWGKGGIIGKYGQSADVVDVVLIQKFHHISTVSQLFPHSEVPSRDKYGLSQLASS